MLFSKFKVFKSTYHHLPISFIYIYTIPLFEESPSHISEIEEKQKQIIKDANKGKSKDKFRY